MTRRYLFGPVTSSFAEEYLLAQRSGQWCLTFNDAGDADISIRPHDNWESVCGRLPSGWQPELVILYLPYTHIPIWLSLVPVPVVGLAPDWTLLWHAYRTQLQACDLILTDTAGVEALAKEGITQARAANLFGLPRSFVEAAWPEQQRTIDLLFIGNLHHAVQRERLPWLNRLAQMGERWKVEIRQGVFGEEYRDLLSRARIVFNRSIRGECNKRVFESACGALLFQEVENDEVGAYLRDGHECVLYRDDNLEELLEYYLEHEEERRAIAERARARVQEFSFANLWAGQLALIEAEWPKLVEGARARAASCARPSLMSRLWSVASGPAQLDMNLQRDLAAALAAEPGNAGLYNALGLAGTLQARRDEATQTIAQRAAGYFRRAVACDASDLMAGLNLAEALALSGDRQGAIEQAQRTLGVMSIHEEHEGHEGMKERTRKNEAGDRPNLTSVCLSSGSSCSSCPSWINSLHFPPAFDTFRIEWERAAWSNAGDRAAEVRAKRTLIRWRLHVLLYAWTGDLVHAYEATIARPDLPESQLGLGSGLLRAKRAAEAVPHLRAGLSAWPFDVDAAAILFQALGEAGDGDGQRRLARERRLLARAAPQTIPPETWFLTLPPVGEELVSIIILCCNELAYTKLCLESVLRSTRGPYELVLVDNGSTDGTGEYLEGIRGRKKEGTKAGGVETSLTHHGTSPWDSDRRPERVVVIRNDKNVGFPAGCNQGLARARGSYLVFLNNDTVVTPGWLEGLVRWSLHEWPAVGLVGAVTNFAPEPQQVHPGYPDLNGLDAFAAKHGELKTGQGLFVDRLTGFCLLVRREVLDKIGGFDERFGIGFFDDDDLCLRAREAGFKLVVANDVYIHHFGSRTFNSLGVDCRLQLAVNLEQFKNKWGREQAARYRLPEGSVVSSPSSVVNEKDAAVVGTRLRTTDHPEKGTGPLNSGVLSPFPNRVSLVMMVKNEEENLPACLESVAGMFEDIVIVDTGSTDRTKEIAHQFGARVFDSPWVDSFAAARNEGIRHALGKNIFWMDADDRVDEANREKIEKLIASLDGSNKGYGMLCHCLGDPVKGVATDVTHVRLFRNLPGIRWKYRVHEQIIPAIRESGGAIIWTDIVIHHTGYQDAALVARKTERDVRLLQLDYNENPEDAFVLFNLAHAYLDTGRAAEALPMLEKSLKLSEAGDSIVRKLYFLIARCYRDMKQLDEALKRCQAGRVCFPEDAELLSQEGQIRRDQGDLAGAEACFVQLLQCREGEHIHSAPAGLNGYWARHQLAAFYQQQGRLIEAEAQWRAAVAQQPHFLQAWFGLEDVYVAWQRWDDLEDVARQLEQEPHAKSEAAVTRARAHLGRKQYEAAKELLRGAIAQHPQAFRPWFILSHVLLLEHKDLPAAEQALREVLARDPNNEGTRQNLAMLLGEMGRAS